MFGSLPQIGYFYVPELFQDIDDVALEDEYETLASSSNTLKDVYRAIIQHEDRIYDSFGEYLDDIFETISMEVAAYSNKIVFRNRQCCEVYKRKCI